MPRPIPTPAILNSIVYKILDDIFLGGINFHCRDTRFVGTNRLYEPAICRNRPRPVPTPTMLNSFVYKILDDIFLGRMNFHCRNIRFAGTGDL